MASWGTGSCVNAILAIAVLFTGLGSGITIALIGGGIALFITPVLKIALHR